MVDLLEIVAQLAWHERRDYECWKIWCASRPVAPPRGGEAPPPA